MLKCIQSVFEVCNEPSRIQGIVNVAWQTKHQQVVLGGRRKDEVERKKKERGRQKVERRKEQQEEGGRKMRKKGGRKRKRGRKRKDKGGAMEEEARSNQESGRTL